LEAASVILAAQCAHHASPSKVRPRRLTWPATPQNRQTDLRLSTTASHQLSHELYILRIRASTRCSRPICQTEHPEPNTNPTPAIRRVPSVRPDCNLTLRPPADGTTARPSASGIPSKRITRRLGARDPPVLRRFIIDLPELAAHGPAAVSYRTPNRADIPQPVRNQAPSHCLPPHGTGRGPYTPHPTFDPDPPASSSYRAPGLLVRPTSPRPGHTIPSSSQCLPGRPLTHCPVPQRADTSRRCADNRPGGGSCRAFRPEPPRRSPRPFRQLIDRPRQVSVAPESVDQPS